MKLIQENITQTINEDFLLETINLNSKTILELGCGSATKTKAIASLGFDRKIIACEVDEIQYKKNIELNIENIEFKPCGAQDIDMPDESVDIVVMFKSFHHIPLELMNQALKEIKRVLKPSGLTYISEPLFHGDQNRLIAMFHDEEHVRTKAFEAIKKSVDDGEFKLFNEIFFNNEVVYSSFKDFQNKQMDLSYNGESDISKELMRNIETEFMKFYKDGEARFLKPNRVDILQKIV